MPCLPEPSVVDLWRTAPALLQQVRRCHLEACGGRRAKRALFGQPDREETRRFVKEELAAIRAADQGKYNFDFSNMRPLSGPFEWQTVAAGEVSPAYQMGRLQSGLQQQQHRSARRLDFDGPRPVTPPSLHVTPPEASRCGTSPADARPVQPVRADAPRADASLGTEPESAAGQRRPASPSEPAAASSASSTLTEALAKRTSPAPRTSASRQTAITDFLRNRKRPSAFTACGDSAAKRASVAGGDGGSPSSLPTSQPTSPSAPAPSGSHASA